MGWLVTYQAPTGGRFFAEKIMILDIDSKLNVSLENKQNNKQSKIIV